ncbi:MAG: PilC/PilY family type IV pilus protein [Thermoanaerobaculaceae bacterium]
MKSKIFLLSFLVAALTEAQGLEKVDPFRQVTTQWVRPNLLLVLDISGSMSWDMFGSGVGTDGRGGATGIGDKPSWTRGQASQCSGNTYKYYWQLTYRYPSRLAMVKNSLGNSVTIWQPPSNSWHDGTIWPSVSGWTKSFSQGAKHTVKYTSTSCYPSSNPPALPQQLASIPIPDPLPPGDLVGTTADKINWGLAVYSGSYANCQKAELVAKVDTLDTGDVTTIENALKLEIDGGLPADGGTPTRGALEFAKTVMNAVKNGGTVTDYSGNFGGQSFQFSPDPKRSCGRSYSVLLVTDGQSNMCNPNGSCWQDPATGRCDGNPGYTCPDSLPDFPAQKSRELWQNQGVRTFAIGVSDQIGPCELNHVAFEGKTDASSPNGDAGFDTGADPRLATYSVTDSDLPSSSNPPYAYFTSNAQEFRSAVAQILAALGTGDYVTSAPSVSSTSEVAGIGLLGTVDYPTLKGHLLAYNVSSPGASFPLLWDAGDVLSSGNKGLTRKIYTWQGQTLVPISAADATTASRLNTICGGCGITPQVVDFMLGNNGSGSPRSWKLGAIVNSTPAVVGPPVEWKQATQLASARAAFQDTYKQRHPLVWVGSSDGMLHAFDLMDGAEILALVPPDLLAKQVQLYNQFQQNPTRFPTGQPQLPDDHIYGVANSMRFADVFFPQGSGGEFKTVLFLTEGPGGTGIYALDITHVYPGRTGVVLPDGSTKDYPADPNYNAGQPFKVLWGYTRFGAGQTTSLHYLRKTWGMPAVAMDDSETFYLAMPPGYLASDESDPDQVNGAYRFLFLRATDGQVVSNQRLTPLSGSQYLTRLYPFADAAFWQTTAKKFQPDNYANQALLGDLFGQLWALNDPFTSLTKIASYTDANAKGSPLYYATAVAAYPMANPKWAVYASISGNFYEKSPKINPPPGWLSNPTLFHRSEIYLTALPTASGVSPCSKNLRLDTLQRPDSPGTYLSRRTQPTSYPLLLIPTENSSLVNALALFSVYDPDAAVCIGKTYLVIAQFNPQTCSLGATVFSGGEGASSGFVITPAGVLYAKSFVGQGGRAGFQQVPNLQPPTTGGEGGAVTWWREIQ